VQKEITNVLNSKRYLEKSRLQWCKTRTCFVPKQMLFHKSGLHLAIPTKRHACEPSIHENAALIQKITFFLKAKKKKREKKMA
jgi:hypothetical protein